MQKSDFDKLSFRKKLILIDKNAIEIDSFIIWFGKDRLSTIYSLSKFFIELVLDINTREFESLNSFDNIEFLSKYPQYLYRIDREINNQLN